MPDLHDAIEDYLASLPDADWQALAARVRPPAEEETPATQFAAILGKQLKGEQ